MTEKSTAAVQDSPVTAADIAALIRTAVNEAVGPLQAEVARLQAGQPRFVKLPPTQRRRPRTYEPPEALQAAATRNLHRGQQANGQTRWLDTPEGRKSIPDDYRPIFGPGDLVRLNPDAPMWGAEGRTWGEVLPSVKDNSQGIGEVICTMFMTETWEPKYKVQVKGLSNGSGDGFRESELLPYEPEY